MGKGWHIWLREVLMPNLTSLEHEQHDRCMSLPIRQCLVRGVYVPRTVLGPVSGYPDLRHHVRPYKIKVVLGPILVQHCIHAALRPIWVWHLMAQR